MTGVPRYGGGSLDYVYREAGTRPTSIERWVFKQDDVYSVMAGLNALQHQMLKGERWDEGGEALVSIARASYAGWPYRDDPFPATERIVVPGKGVRSRNENGSEELLREFYLACRHRQLEGIVGVLSDAAFIEGLRGGRVDLAAWERLHDRLRPPRTLAPYWAQWSADRHWLAKEGARGDDAALVGAKAEFDRVLLGKAFGDPKKDSVPGVKLAPRSPDFEP